MRRDSRATHSAEADTGRSQGATGGGILGSVRQRVYAKLHAFVSSVKDLVQRRYIGFRIKSKSAFETVLHALTEDAMTRATKDGVHVDDRVRAMLLENDAIMDHAPSLADDAFFDKHAPVEAGGRPSWEAFVSGEIDRDDLVSHVTGLVANKITGILDTIMGSQITLTIQQEITLRAFMEAYFLEEAKSYMGPAGLYVDSLAYENLFEKGADTHASIVVSVFTGNGPVLTKFLQQLLSGLKDTSATPFFREFPEMATVKRMVFNRMPQFPEELFTRIVREATDPQRNIHRVLHGSVTTTHPSAIGSASTAQVHDATYSVCGDGSMDAVLKVVRPLQLLFLLCEIDLFRHVAWRHVRTVARRLQRATPGMTDADVDRYVVQCRRMGVYLLSAYAREMDVEQEYINAVYAFEHYDGRRAGATGVRSTLPLAMSKGPINSIVYERAPGNALQSHIKKLDTYSLETRTELHNALISLISVWLDHALFRSGFFHADLHGGNIHWDPASPGELWVLDFGSCGALNRDQQCDLLNGLFVSGEFVAWPAAVADRKTTASDRRRLAPKEWEINHRVMHKIVGAFLRLCRVCRPWSTAQTEDLVEKMMATDEYSYSALIVRFVRYAPDVGVCASSPILWFGRGLMYLDGLTQRTSLACAPETGGTCAPFDIADVARPIIIPRNLDRIIHYKITGRACGPPSACGV